MDSRTGQIYESKAAALEAGVPEADIVEIDGQPSAVGNIARTYQELRRLEQAIAAQQQTVPQVKPFTAKDQQNRKARRRAEKEARKAQRQAAKKGGKR